MRRLAAAFPTSVQFDRLHLRDRERQSMTPEKREQAPALPKKTFGSPLQTNKVVQWVRVAGQRVHMLLQFWPTGEAVFASYDVQRVG